MTSSTDRDPLTLTESDLVREPCAEVIALLPPDIHTRVECPHGDLVVIDVDTVARGWLEGAPDSRHEWVSEVSVRSLTSCRGGVSPCRVSRRG
jgi:hypothetical protein